jgi:hypothetical protein
MDIIQLVKGDTGPQLKASVNRSDTGSAFVGTSNTVLKIRKKGTTTTLVTIDVSADDSNLGTGLLVFPLSTFLTNEATTAGFYEAEIEFTLADGSVISVFELIDLKVREDF